MEQKEKTWLTEFSRDYGARELHRSDLKPDPIAQFREWFEEGKSTLQEPTAMALATADAQGRPSQRMVLMKGFDHEGILFGTSYESRKSRELKENPHASLLFYWPALERQVRITGPISRASVTESDEIFMARRRGSRIAAVVSTQSAPIESREKLEAAYAAETAKFEGKEVKRPATWGAYRVGFETFEFWQGGRDRLHDRFLYSRAGSQWKIERLQP
jgi:pyridoxamine 5'-phosphate oxidase